MFVIPMPMYTSSLVSVLLSSAENLVYESRRFVVFSSIVTISEMVTEYTIHILLSYTVIFSFCDKHLVLFHFLIDICSFLFGLFILVKILFFVIILIAIATFLGGIYFVFIFP